MSHVWYERPPWWARGFFFFTFSSLKYLRQLSTKRYVCSLVVKTDTEFLKSPTPNIPTTYFVLNHNWAISGNVFAGLKWSFCNSERKGSQLILCPWTEAERWSSGWTRYSQSCVRAHPELSWAPLHRCNDDFGSPMDDADKPPLIKTLLKM